MHRLHADTAKAWGTIEHDSATASTRKCRHCTGCTPQLVRTSWACYFKCVDQIMHLLGLQTAVKVLIQQSSTRRFDDCLPVHGQVVMEPFCWILEWQRCL